MLSPLYGSLLLDGLGVPQQVLKDGRNKLIEWHEMLSETSDASSASTEENDVKRRWLEQLFGSPSSSSSSSSSPSSKSKSKSKSSSQLSPASIAAVEKLVRDVGMAAPESSPNLRLADTVESFTRDGKLLVFGDGERQSMSAATREFYRPRDPLDGELVRMVNSAAASSAMAERAFSLMKIIHSDLRTSMGESTLEMLVVVQSWLKKILDMYPAQQGVSDYERLRQFKKYIADR